MKKVFCLALLVFCVCLAAIVAHKFALYYCAKVELDAQKDFSGALLEQDMKSFDDMLRGSEKLFEKFLENAKSAKIPDSVGAQGMREILEGYKNVVLSEDGGSLAGLRAEFFENLKKNKDDFARVFSEKFASSENAAENSRLICANTDFYLKDFCAENSFEKAAEAAALQLAKSLSADLEKWGARFAVRADFPRGAKLRLSEMLVCESALPIAPADFSEFSAALEKAMSSALKKSQKAFAMHAQNFAKPNLQRLHEKAYSRAIYVYLK